MVSSGQWRRPTAGLCSIRLGTTPSNWKLLSLGTCADIGTHTVKQNHGANTSPAAFESDGGAFALTFHVVFTVPAEVAEIAFHNKAVVYAILFDAVAATLKTIAADPRHLGGEIGFLAILHTWGQALTHHPHIHCLVPGGALSADRRWLGCRPRFFLLIHVLSRLFRRLFLERLQAAYADSDEAGHLFRSKAATYSSFIPAGVPI